MSEETLFQEALSRSPEERAAFLAYACAGRPALLAAVEALLAAHEKSGNILDQPPADPGQAVDSDPDPAPWRCSASGRCGRAARRPRLGFPGRSGGRSAARLTPFVARITPR